MRIVGTLLASTVLGATLTVTAVSAEGTQPQVRWKLASAFPSALDVFGPNGQRLTDNVRRMSGGRFDIRFYEPGALVPPLEAFSAVSRGSVDIAYTTPAYHAGKIPALAFFSSVPFGPQPAEYLAWLRYGGGNEIYRELYAEHDLVGFHCALIVPEASGWFKTKIETAEDLRGLKMRIVGLGGKVLHKMGVSTQLLAASDVYPSLERGVIDAAELSFPSIDLKFGYHELARHYYFPGWHQQTSLLEVLMNKDRFEALPDAYQAMLEIACGEAQLHTMALGASKQAAALHAITGKGVSIHRWPREMLADFEAAWEEVIAEGVQEDPVFKRVYDSYSAFRAEYAVWKAYGYLN